MIIDVLEIYPDGRQELVQKDVFVEEVIPQPIPPTSEERLAALEAAMLDIVLGGTL